MAPVCEHCGNVRARHSARLGESTAPGGIELAGRAQRGPDLHTLRRAVADGPADVFVRLSDHRARADDGAADLRWDCHAAAGADWGGAVSIELASCVLVCHESRGR